MEDSKRESIVEMLRQETINLQSEQNERYFPLLDGSKETMRNLSLVSGGLATGSLVIIGFTNQVILILIVIGVIILLIEVVLIFGYLIHQDTIAADNYYAVRKKTIYPRARILIAYDQWKDGDITVEEFDSILKENAKEVRAYKNEVNKEVINADPHTNRMDQVFIGMILFGIVLIALGLLLPHTCSRWNFMCI